MNDNLENQPRPGEKPTDDILMRFAEKVLQNQAAQIELEKDQIELQKEKITADYKYAENVISAQAQDRANEREHQRRLQRARMIFASILVFLLAGFLGYALHLDKDQIALEIIKAIAFIGAGGMGGYAIGRYRSQQTNGR